LVSKIISLPRSTSYLSSERSSGHSTLSGTLYLHSAGSSTPTSRTSSGEHSPQYYN